jgi:hypothetical protein
MSALDPTFGPKMVYNSAPGPIADSGPLAGLQFFGMGDIDSSAVN